MRVVAELLVARVPWSADGGFAPAAGLVDRALALGVGGFILDGGTPEAVLGWVREVRRRSAVPLLIGADVSRGAGQVFAGATGLPPYAAIGRLDDDDAVRRAARLTAREARTAGVNWILAPSADLAVHAANAALGTDTFGADPVRVGRFVGAWVGACQAEGVLASVGRFPGLGRAITHPHGSAPEVDASEEALRHEDLLPFRAAITAGVAVVAVAHARYPTFDPSGATADTSPAIMRDLLRDELGFDGLVATDCLGNPSVRATIGAGEAAVRAAAVGCDLLIGGADLDLESVVAALDAAMHDGRLLPDRVEQARRLRRKWAQWATPPMDFLKPASSDVQWAAALADRALVLVRGADGPVRAPLDVLVVNDGAASASVAPLLAALRTAGASAREGPRPVPGARGTVVVALFGGSDPFAPRYGYRPAALAQVRDAVRTAEAAGRPALVAQFGEPGLATALADGVPVLSAWTGDAAMQHAVGRWLAARRRGG
ncbi:MAG: glycoside hydrolase family 3 N-terminal domain-containing protein [Gemmatimonadota bacterium]